MIVKTNQNATVYAKLFERANKALNYIAPDGTINDQEALIHNIDEYFAVIKELVQTGDPIFTILPADEDMFHIDANTRKISIPKSFSAGASVIGDEVAEIIYFDIDRYFDIQDLANTQIFIQCQTANNIKYLCHAINITTEFPGSDKLIFGWPLTSEITETAGNVSFAIRFYNRKRDIIDPNSDNDNLDLVDGDDLVYSFSTLTHTIRINPSLNFELSNLNTKEVIDKNAIIYNRIKNSTIAGSIPAVAPIFSQLIVVDNIPKQVSGTSGQKIVEIGDYLYAKATYNDATIQQALDAGTVKRGAEIDYEWRVKKPDSETYITLDNIDMYKPTNDITGRTPGDIYYYIIQVEGRDENDQPILIDKYDIYADDDWSNPENILEKFASINELTYGAGQYSVRAIDIAGRGSARAESDWITYDVPGPASVILVLSNPDGGKILMPDENLHNNATIQLATSTMDTDGRQAGSVTYKWKIADSLTGAGVLLNNDDVEDEFSPITITDREGYIYLEASHQYGPDTIVTESDRCRVTYPAGAISLAVTGTTLDEDTGERLFRGGNVVVTPTAADNRTDNTYLFQWYRKAAGTDEYVIMPGCNTDTINPSTIGAEQGDRYYCHVINTYGISSTSADTFSILKPVIDE